MSIGVMLFNPFTGKPRHPDDIASDPRGILVWDGEEPLKVSPPQRTWVGLTDNEIALINADYPHPQGFARAIITKLKEKNT